jgi:hypothetical protein
MLSTLLSVLGLGLLADQEDEDDPETKQKKFNNYLKVMENLDRHEEIVDEFGIDWVLEYLIHIISFYLEKPSTQQMEDADITEWILHIPKIAKYASILRQKNHNVASYALITKKAIFLGPTPVILSNPVQPTGDHFVDRILADIRNLYLAVPAPLLADLSKWWRKDGKDWVEAKASEAIAKECAIRLGIKWDQLFDDERKEGGSYNIGATTLPNVKNTWLPRFKRSLSQKDVIFDFFLGFCLVHSVGKKKVTLFDEDISSLWASEDIKEHFSDIKSQYPVQSLESYIAMSKAEYMIIRPMLHLLWWRFFAAEPFPHTFYWYRLLEMIFIQEELAKLRKDQP